MFDETFLTQLLVLINTILVAILAFYAKRQLKVKTEEVEVKKEEVNIIKNGHREEKPADTEELWNEVNDLRGTLNKTLLAVNKQLRGHGRTIQAGGDKTILESKPGLIKRPLA